MAVQMLLLHTLEDLGSNEFEAFKWYLQIGALEGYQPIPKSCLENADHRQTVETIIQRYGEDKAVTITVEALKKASLNNAAANLMRKFSEGTAASSSSSSPHSAPSAPSASSAHISANQGSIVFAPNITGCTTGPINFTIPKA